MFDLTGLADAARIVGEVMLPTPQYAWPLLGQRTGCDVWVKHENHTPTGAFKVRGGLVYVDRLPADKRGAAGLVSATRGNHGQSLAFAAGRAGIPVTIVVPHGNGREKNAAMRALGAALIEKGRDFDEARLVAAGIAADRGAQMVPPFHADLVCGVATYALELFTTVTDIDTIYVPIGMGSGICGLIRTRDLLGLKTRIVGVVSTGAPAMALSFEAGHVIETERADTIADGMACRRPDPEALAMIRAGADRIVQVTDEEVIAAMKIYWTDTHNLAEGAGAAPLAALLKDRSILSGKRVGLILCGANIDIDTGLRLMQSGQ